MLILQVPCLRTKPSRWCDREPAPSGLSKDTQELLLRFFFFLLNSDRSRHVLWSRFLDLWGKIRRDIWLEWTTWLLWDQQYPQCVHKQKHSRKELLVALAEWHLIVVESSRSTGLVLVWVCCHGLTPRSCTWSKISVTRRRDCTVETSSRAVFFFFFKYLLIMRLEMQHTSLRMCPTCCRNCCWVICFNQLQMGCTTQLASPAQS